MNNRMGFPALRPEEQQRFQAELLRELGKMVERYNRGNSSSIRSEKAENILGSMLYCVSVELRQAANPAAEMRRTPGGELFRRGQNRVKALVEESKRLYLDVLSTRTETDLMVYNDTLDKAVPAFFQTYDINYAADENGMLLGPPDYPLLHQDNSRSGILFMRAYLEELLRENKFCSGYRKNYIRAVLLLHGQKHHLDYREMVVNIPELLLKQDKE